MSKEKIISDGNKRIAKNTVYLVSILFSVLTHIVA